MSFSRTKAWVALIAILLCLALLPIGLRYQNTHFNFNMPSIMASMPDAPPKPVLPLVVATLSKDAVVVVNQVVNEAQASTLSPPVPEQKVAVFVVQLASYAERERAQNSVKILQEAGYSAYVRLVQSPHTLYYRVLVGPVLSEKNALELKDSLAYRFHQMGFVVKTFDPLHD
jgi:cell division septation protein DedD